MRTKPCGCGVGTTKARSSGRTRAIWRAIVRCCCAWRAANDGRSPSMTVTDELIELRGLRFHYRDWAGPRAGAPDLVLLHGFTGHARSWDAFAQGMSDRYRVLALDQRGHGESGWAGPGGYGIGEMTMDLEAFVI